MPYRARLGWKDWILVVLLSLPTTLTVAALLGTAGFLAGNTNGATRWLFGALAVVFAVLTALIAYLRQSKTGVLKRVATRIARSVSGSGHPVLIALGEYCQRQHSPDADARLTSLKRSIIETVRRYCGDVDLDDKRATLYLFNDALDTLTLWGYVGRDVPRREFRASNRQLERDVVEFGRGDAGRYAVDRKNDIFRELSGRIDAGRATYRSYMATPLIVEDQPFGLLTVDCASVRGFLEIDEGTLRLLAGVLVAGLAAELSTMAM